MNGPVSTPRRAPAPPVSPAPPDVAGAEVRALSAWLCSADCGTAVSASVYETARLVSTAPWLAGHERRVAFLVASQLDDGAWSGPEDYRLVPALSAAEALLAELGRRLASGAVSRAAEAVLRALPVLLARAGEGLPDTIAAEYLIPWLVQEVNARLAHLAEAPAGAPPLARDALALRLPPPALADGSALRRLHAAADAGQPLPGTVAHSWEVLGTRGRRSAAVAPVAGAVGLSPAATAAWLAGPDECPAAGHPCLDYLESTQRRYGGPVPGVSPISVFERAWVVSALAEAGLGGALPDTVVTALRADLGERGAPAGPGLPPDADDTAAVLHALALTGDPQPADCLRPYESDAWFTCFPGERTPSTSTNAHILEALGTAVARDAEEGRWLRAARAKIASWLLDAQHADGSWTDKWHASPFYATACCAVALARHGNASAAPAVRRAVDWVLGNQRADGSWGCWEGTDEETAYAVRTLLLTTEPRGPADPPPVPGLDDAAARGGAFLTRPGAGATVPPLWHDKDLYAPHTVVHAARLAAIHLTRSRSRGGHTRTAGVR
ncbi:prenyltransferase/squalene oxidase repeat-containing protein [Streptomyces sp. NPDC088350]|uniref:prenyltransferase/squalene oxidase repeat-containing protein n=1 Tax=Streptomyces sp. NPDC088350 TaxID=3365854 RepID=UPI003801DCE6